MNASNKDLVLFPKTLVLAVAGGIVVTGALYFFYKRGRIDEINELCSIVNEHGEIDLAFKYCGKTTNILLQQR